jgi:hypothetical protein
MNNIGIHKHQPAHGLRQDDPHPKKSASTKDAETFANAVKDGNQAGSTTGADGAKETDHEKLQEAFKQARMNLTMSTGRMMQQNAKDIEREYIDY